MISGVMPIKLMARQRKLIYETRERLGKAIATKEAKEAIIAEWQAKWKGTVKGKWIRRLIARIGPWISRKHGEVNYYLTQFLSGHGFFLNYLFKMGKARNLVCVYCGAEMDSAEHTFFACDRWTCEQSDLERSVGPITPENIVGKMLDGMEDWDAVERYVESILHAKKSVEYLVDRIGGQ